MRRPALNLTAVWKLVQFEYYFLFGVDVMNDATNALSVVVTRHSRRKQCSSQLILNSIKELNEKKIIFLSRTISRMSIEKT